MGSLVEKYGWHEWLGHTNFSFLVGASHPHEYVNRALALGYRGLGICDLDGVYGLARTHLEWRQARDRLRLFHGAELHLTPGHHDEPLVYRDTLAFVAQSHVGYANLCRLCTYAHRDGKTGAFIPWKVLGEFSTQDLVAIQPMRGLLRRADDPAQQKELEERCAALRDLFPGRFYLSVSRHLHPAEDQWVGPTLRLAARLGLPCLLSQDPFFHEPSRKEMSDLLQAIRLNRSLDEAVPHMFPNSERSLHDLYGIERRFCDLPVYESALAAGRELADSCHFDFSELSYHYPKEMLPAGHTAQSYLESLVWDAVREIYGDPAPARIRDLLVHELGLIETLEFADYFLTVWDIVRWARSRGILCQGRGSAANSAVCFVLGVTSVDPSLFDLLFERFVSVERGDPPDIDVDFEHERREEVIQYIYERYGRPRAAMVANVITFRGKGALRAVGKALGVPEPGLSRVAHTYESRRVRANQDQATSGSEAVLATVRRDLVEERNKDDAKAQDVPDPAYVPWGIWARMAEALQGFPRHLGLHSGGFMLSDKPLDELVPQEPATMEGRSVVQWCKDDIEGLGFFKIDVLALGMLTAVRKTFEAVEKTYGRTLSMTTVPQEDPATYAMIQRADTVGTFQIESRAQMSMLPRLRPRTFYDLVIEVAIIRPGPIQGGMIHPYLRRRHGEEPVTIPDERLRPILARTLGVPIFQEQVMRVAMEVGGFSPGEANELRRHMGAWSIKGDMGPWLRRLAQGMKENGISEEFTQVILEQMKGFADYGFPESHSVSFALIAYVSSYLKCHYPAAFFAAVLNSQPMGFYAPHALLQAAQRSGVNVLPLCVNRSDYDVTLENVSPEGKVPVYGLRLGLRMVHSLQEKAAKELVQARQRVGGHWHSLAQCLEESALSRSDLTALAAADAFRTFGLERKAALWLAEAAPFAAALEDEEPDYPWREEASLERIERDFAATSVSVGSHPAAVIKEEHWCYPPPISKLTVSRELERTAKGRSVTVFGMVLVRQAPPAANGMVFFTAEDETGFLNLVFTPDIFRRYAPLLESQSFLCVHGRLQREREGHSLMVKGVYAPQLKRADVIPLDEELPAARTPAESEGVTTKTLQKSRNYM